MKTEVVEQCPHCDAYTVMEWDVREYGHKAFCPHCGNVMLLCDECSHEITDENPQGLLYFECDWHIGQDGLGHCRRNPEANKGAEIDEKTALSVASK